MISGRRPSTGAIPPIPYDSHVSYSRVGSDFSPLPCDTAKESSALKADSWRKISCRSVDSNPRQYSAWLFGRSPTPGADPQSALKVDSGRKKPLSQALENRTRVSTAPGLVSTDAPQLDLSRPALAIVTFPTAG